jgi:tetratricopeptide (TPR) repeat protein
MREGTIQGSSGGFVDVLLTEYLHAGRRLLECGAWLGALRCAYRALSLAPSCREAAALLSDAVAQQGAPEPGEMPSEVRRLGEWVGRLDAAYVAQQEVMGSGCAEGAAGVTPEPAGTGREADLGELRAELSRMADRVRQEVPPDREAVHRQVQELCGRLGVRPGEVPTEPHEDSPFDDLFRLSLQHELHNLGNHFYKAARFDDAVLCFSIVLEEYDRDMLETAFNRALAFTRQRLYFQALSDIDHCVALQPTNAEIHYTRGLILNYMERHDEAMDAFREALRLDPDYEKARKELDATSARKRAKESGSSGGSGSSENHQEIKDFSKYIERPEVTLDDVAGCEDAKDEVRKVIAYLNPQHREVLKHWGVSLPTGVVLHGRPGCGKTMLVRAMAGEVRCPVYSVPGKEIISMWAGQTERNLGNLWEEASRHEAAIIHLAEFDHVAQRRTDMRDPDGSEHWANRTITALLELLDGMRGRCNGLVVVADTNRLENIDPALLRAGRLGKLIRVDPPKDGVAWAEVWAVVLTAEHRSAKRLDLYGEEIRVVLRDDRREWAGQAFLKNRLELTGKDRSGLAELAVACLERDLAPADVAEVVRQTKDERAMLQIGAGIELGPITADDLRFHLDRYEPYRDEPWPPLRGDRGVDQRGAEQC